MIRRIVIEQFKSFERVDLTLGHFNLFIGPNASGKSNFLDALRVLQGIGYGLTINEILNGKPKSPIGEAWEGIRGGAVYAGQFAGNHTLESMRDFAVNFDLSLHLDKGAGEAHYQLAFNQFSTRCRKESLSQNRDVLFETSTESAASDRVAVLVRKPESDARSLPALPADKPILTQLQGNPAAGRPLQQTCMDFAARLADLQNFNPSPTVLRQYSSSSTAERMGGSGENFAAVANQICLNTETKHLFLSWLRQLTPDEVEDIHFFSGALGEPLFGIKQKGRQFPAPVLSDGTLRFAAFAAAFFQPSIPRMMAFEEIENGVHPSRLRLVLDLMRSQSKSPAPQVFATSHSPVILDWLNEEDYPFVFLCRRNAESGATEIRTLAELLKSTPPGDVRLSDLAVEGWFEAVP